VKRLCAALVGLAAPLLLLPASAQEWPSRPVRIISTFAAGGTADVLARVVAEHMSAAFGQQFFVEVRAGAGGSIGVQAVVNSPPDGYNFAVTNVTLLALAPTTNPNLGYHPLRDLTNIGYIAGSPIVFSVNAASGMKTLADFIARAKQSEKPLTYSSSGLGSSGHLVGELFAQIANLTFEHVPYRGASQGLTDLAGGHIAFSVQTVSSSAGLIRGGTLRGIAVAANERVPDFPEIPTFRELGYPDVVANIWFSLSGPAGLPADMVEKLNRELIKGMSKPQIAEKLRQDGMVTEALSPEGLRRLVETETVRWRPIIERAGLVAKK
jgi:tripartite-type tricarboxylate transporter receptor subunit TctC